MASKTAVASALSRLKFKPVDEAVAIVEDSKKPDADARLLAVRAKVVCDLLQYVQPKLRSIEVTGRDKGPVQLELFNWQALLRQPGDPA